jgi:periplasmic protein CpxP/Spy
MAPAHLSGILNTMNHFLRASTGLAAMAAVLSVAYAVTAQDPPAPGPGAPPTAQQRADWMHARMEARAKALHDILNLRPDQEAAFQAFQAAMAPQPHGDRHEHGDQAAGPVTTPERLDHMAERMAKHEAAFHQRADAIKAFYAVLSSDQQRAFDALPLMGGDHHGGHRGMGHGPMGAHDGPPPQG